MRGLMAWLVTAVVAYATVAVAAGPGIDPAGLGAGTGVVARCDRDGVVVGYSMRWTGHLAVDRVVVRDIDDACVRLDLTLVLIVNGESVELGTAPVGHGGSERPLRSSSPLPWGQPGRHPDESSVRWPTLLRRGQWHQT